MQNAKLMRKHGPKDSHNTGHNDNYRCKRI